MRTDCFLAQRASRPPGPGGCFLAQRASRFSLLAAVPVLLLTTAAFAQNEPMSVSVEVLGSRYLKLGEKISRVSIGAGEIADVAAFPSDQLLITGKKIGTTTATVWSSNDQVTLIQIEVTYPLATMRAALKKGLPGAAALDVQPAGAAVVLSGEVPSVADVERAEGIVRGLAAGVGTDVQIVNLLTVPGDQQVQLEVAFAEVSRTGLRQIGLNFWARDTSGSKSYAGGLLSPGNTLDAVSPQLGSTPAVGELGVTGDAATATIPLLSAPLSGGFGAIFSSTLGGFPFSAALSLLSEKGYARTLAEPTLVAMSGQKATFLAGGEFPIPLPQSLGQIAVDYKKFGVQLQFTPTVVGDTIQLALAVTVSDVDPQLGIRLASVTVPGLTERHSETTIRLKDGQSFVVAGLLSDRVRSSVDKVPWLGDVPILGTLFRSSSYRREETELLVVVTAHRVRPLGARPELPGEHDTVDPSDLELFLLGRHESLDNGDQGPQPAAARKRASLLQPVGVVGFKR